MDETVSDEVLQANQYAVVRASSNNFYSQKVKYMVLKLEKVYPSGILSLQKLKTHGLGQVQIQARTGRQLQKYIDEVCAMFEEGEQANAES